MRLLFVLALLVSCYHAFSQSAEEDIHNCFPAVPTVYYTDCEIEFCFDFRTRCDIISLNFKLYDRWANKVVDIERNKAPFTREVTEVMSEAAFHDKGHATYVYQVSYILKGHYDAICTATGTVEVIK